MIDACRSPAPRCRGVFGEDGAEDPVTGSTSVDMRVTSAFRRAQPRAGPVAGGDVRLLFMVMTDHPVSRFGHVELEDMPADLRERIGAIAEKSGFVPNVFRALARRPAELRAFLDYHDALMDPPRSDQAGGLSKAERELVVVATSGANSCTYCVVAHGAILRVRTKDPEIADRVATNPYGVELSPRERAIVDLALLVATDSAALTDAELDDARLAGLSEDEIWDVGAITALFAMSNRLAHLTALRPNPEFYLMGRLPR